MGWLSLCVCGTKGKPDDEKKAKKNERRKRECGKKSKKSKRYSKQKRSHEAPSSSVVVDESSRKSQDDWPVEKEEVAVKEWANGNAVNYVDDRAKIGGLCQTDRTEADYSPNDRWSCREADENPDDESFPERSATDEENKRVDDEEEEPDVEADLDGSASGSAIPDESENASFRESEAENKQTVAVETSLARRYKERTSSRINFSSNKQGRPTKAETKRSRKILPPIKRAPCADAQNPRVDGEQVPRANEGTNKFGFRTAAAAFCEQTGIRRKLNSCSFEVRSSEDEERGVGKARTRAEGGSMIPRLASPLRPGASSIKGDNDRSEFVQNGRVHSAVVSGINLEQRTVTVEWFERGETKGKEVEIDAILALNRDLNQKMMAPPQINNHMLASRARQDSSAEEDEGVDESENQEEGSLGRHGGHTARNGLASATLPVRVTSRLSHSTRPSIPVKAGSNRQLSRPTGRPTNIMPSNTSVNGHGDSVSGLTGRRELENIPPTPTATVTQYNLATPLQNKQKQLHQQQQQQQQQQMQQQQAQVENGRGRRSNVVKEVERLKKNREERRQRQAELKEEKEALMNQDPGNPNWEFLAMIREYQNSIEFRPLRETDAVEDHQITVCVRKRPLNKKEYARKEIDVISVPSKDQMVVHEPKSKVDLTKYLDNQIFRFDYAFDETCNNEIVYKYTAKPLVQTIFEGGMATCFAYGQTGSGKTHTMGGDFNGKTQDCKKGIYAMVAKDVFKCLKLAKYRPLNLVISASFFEIYSGKVFDLLADKEKLRVLEDGKQQVQIVGLTEKVVETCDEVLKLIQHGNSARTSGQTSANSNSSRSHAVFQIIARIPGTHKVHGKFSLIDLAGNERGADTSSANRQTRMEGAEINKSLLALKECIRALSRKGTHLPFRASKLTQVLRDSFIGEKSKTCMIAMISPGMSSCEHSLNTLRYADRVKELAATDPTEIKASPTDDERCLKIEEQGNNSVLSDSDLAQLRSLNEGELSQDLYTFHEAVSALQMLEEEVLDTHKLVMDSTTKFLNDSHSVFSATHEVDYDQEDPRGKTKENSIFTLNRHGRGSRSMLNTAIMINNGMTSVSDIDTQPILNTNVNVIRGSSLKSPWKNDMESKSDLSTNDFEKDSNVYFRTSTIKSDITNKNMSTGQNPGKNLNIDEAMFALENSVQKSNQNERVKLLISNKKKSQKYHWSGTFCIKKNPRRKDKLYNSFQNGQLMNHKHNYENTEGETVASQEDIFCSNELSSHNNDDSQKDEWTNDISCQSCIDICVNEFDKSDHFEDYDVELDNGLLPHAAAYPKFNINLRRKKTNNIGDKHKEACNVYSHTNKRESISFLHSSSAHDINNINKEERDNLCSAKKFTDLSANIKPNSRIKINNNKNKSTVQSYCYKIQRFLSFLKNVILFLFLPMIYVIFFIYVQGTEKMKKE